jgi:hypothetical protein
MSVFLIGVKLGTYGFIRFIIPLLPEASRDWFWLVAAFGAAGIVYGSLIALVQSNLRRVLAFGSLSHMGAVIIGIFSLNFYGLQGGLLQMINLGVTGAGLFFVAGFIATRVGAPELSAGSRPMCRCSLQPFWSSPSQASACRERAVSTASISSCWAPTRRTGRWRSWRASVRS